MQGFYEFKKPKFAFLKELIYNSYFAMSKLIMTYLL